MLEDERVKIFIALSARLNGQFYFLEGETKKQ